MSIFSLTIINNKTSNERKRTMPQKYKSSAEKITKIIRHSSFPAEYLEDKYALYSDVGLDYSDSDEASFRIVKFRNGKFGVQEDIMGIGSFSTTDVFSVLFDAHQILDVYDRDYKDYLSKHY